MPGITFKTTKHLADGSDLEELQIPPGSILATRRKGDAELTRIIVNGEVFSEKRTGEIPAEWLMEEKKK